MPPRKTRQKSEEGTVSTTETVYESGDAVEAEFVAEQQATNAPPPREHPSLTAQKKAAAKEPSEQEYQQMEQLTKEALDSMPKVRIRLFQVPHDSSDKKLPDENVSINGYTYTLKRGETIEVPELVADVLEQGGRI